MAAAENFRQEIAIRFGDETYRVRPSFATIAAIEAAIGQAAYDLGRKLLDGRASTLEIASIMSVVTSPEPGMQEPKLTPMQCGEIILDDGYIDLLDPLGTLLLRAMRGNKAHVKEEAERKKKAEEAAAGAGSHPQGEGAAS